MKFFKKHIAFRLLIYCSPIFLLYGLSYLPNRGLEKPYSFFKSYIFDTQKSPIFYSESYNISFWGLEKLHPFDSMKYKRVHDLLIDKNVFSKEDFVSAPRPDKGMLSLFHTKEYLSSHNSPVQLAHITEVGVTAVLPSRLTQKKVLIPMLHAAGGSILATLAALETGWAINLGGGFHHASKAKGHGFCAFNDITMSIETALKRDNVRNVMYIDLDAHQGDGPSTDFKNRKDVFILDVYNGYIFPNDERAKSGIDLNVELSPGETGADYLEKLSTTLDSIDKKYDLIVYNAGTDILSGDPLGQLDVDPTSVVKRDETIFKFAKNRQTPIVMLLSGGYQKSNALVIARSIENLKQKNLIGY